MVKFVTLRDKEWRVVRAIPESLTISEVSSRSGLPQYEVSRILSYKTGLRAKAEIRFEINYRKFGILKVSTISTRDIKEVPYMRSKRIVRIMGRKYYLYAGLLPEDEEILDKWLAHFEEESIVVRALERAWWDPRSEATVHTNGELCGVVDKLRELANDNSIRIVERKVFSLDEADAAILIAKLVWAFNSLRKAEAYSEKYLGKRIPHQTLSRHFRRHVLKAWKGNRIRLYRDLNEIPYKLIYIEGNDAVRVARALVQLPWFHTAYLDVNKALVSGQPPCESALPLCRVLGEYDISALEMIMEPSLERVIPVNQLLKKLVEVRVRGR